MGHVVIQTCSDVELSMSLWSLDPATTMIGSSWKLTTFLWGRLFCDAATNHNT
jgi:hypothetical protein